MANIRINQLPEDLAPVESDVLAVDSTLGGTTRKVPLPNVADLIRPVASQPEAEAGSNNTKTMTPLRVKQQIDARVADTSTAKAATDDVELMTSVKVFAQTRTVVHTISPTQPEFAGGMPTNGMDDCAPAARAILNYAKTISASKGLYDGGVVKIVWPDGKLRFLTPDPDKTDRILNLTDANNITIEGQGTSATEARWESNHALFRSDYIGDPSGTSSVGPNPLLFCNLKGMRLYGPGYAQTNADAIDFGANNNTRVDDMRIYAARRAIAYQDSFNSNLSGINANGLGGLACYDGIYAKDGTVGMVENAMRIESCRIRGAKRWGFRGEKVAGTDVYSTEILECEGVGVYLGDSPNGSDLKWFSWFGGLIDTCSDLVMVKAGSSTIAEMVHFTGVWDSYAYEGSPGVGVGVEFVGMKNSSFTAAMLANTVYAANIQDCEKVTLRVETVAGYDRLSQGAIAVLLQNSTGCTVDIGTSDKTTGSPSTIAVQESGPSDRNLVRGNLDGDVILVGANSKFEGIKVP